MFQELPGVVRRKRSWCQTMALPSPDLVQLPHVRSSPAGNAVPSSNPEVEARLRASFGDDVIAGSFDFADLLNQEKLEAEGPEALLKVVNRARIPLN